MQAQSVQVAQPARETAMPVTIETAHSVRVSSQASLQTTTTTSSSSATATAVAVAVVAAAVQQPPSSVTVASPPSTQSEESFKRGETPKKKQQQRSCEGIAIPRKVSFNAECDRNALKFQPVTAAPKPAAAGIKFSEMSTVFIGKTSAPKEEELQSFVDSVVQGRTDLSHAIDPSEISDATTRLGAGASGAVFK